MTGTVRCFFCEISELIELSKKYNNEYFSAFEIYPNEITILAYDALGLINYCWSKNNQIFKTELLYNKEGFKGLHGEFIIKNNLSEQDLKIYKVSKKKFIKIF